jgi:hypothetical protein
MYAWFSGGFEFGNSADTDFRATVERSIILGEPVLIVATNYRLNGKYFLDHPLQDFTHFT